MHRTLQGDTNTGLSKKDLRRLAVENSNRQGVTNKGETTTVYDEDRKQVMEYDYAHLKEKIAAGHVNESDLTDDEQTRLNDHEAAVAEAEAKKNDEKEIRQKQKQVLQNQIDEHNNSRRSSRSGSRSSNRGRRGSRRRP